MGYYPLGHKQRAVIQAFDFIRLLRKCFLITLFQYFRNLRHHQKVMKIKRGLDIFADMLWTKIAMDMRDAQYADGDSGVRPSIGKIRSPLPTR